MTKKSIRYGGRSPGLGVAVRKDLPQKETPPEGQAHLARKEKNIPRGGTTGAQGQVTNGQVVHNN